MRAGIRHRPEAPRMHRRVLTTLPILAILASLTGCFGEQTVEKRIRIIAHASVDGEPVEGSTVMEMTWRSKSDGRMYIETYGEALILDLKGRGTVYVLNKAFGRESHWAGGWSYVVLDALHIEGQGT